MTLRLTYNISILVAVLVAIFCVQFAHAQQASFLRIQLSDGSCGSNTGTARGTPAGTGWSSYASDSDNWDPDCVRIAIAGSIARELDIRLCIWLQDDGGAFGWGGGPGFEVCGPWASNGGGWSGWAHENGDMWAVDRARVRVDSRFMDNRYISNMRAGIQSSRATSKVCSQGVGTAAYTPYMSGGGGWSGWAPDTNEGSFACARTYLEPTVLNIVTPVTNLSISVNGGAYTSPSSITIPYNASITLQWNAANGPTSCARTAGPADFVVADVSGADGSVTAPSAGSSMTYTVQCTNEAGSHGDSIVVTQAPPPPVTNLSISVNGGAYTSPSSITIPYNASIALQWSATNAPTSCARTAGPADFDVTTVPGSDGTVSLPSVGSSMTYTVQCTNITGSHPDSITVTRSLPPPPVTTLSISVNGGAYTSPSSISIPYNGTISLQWSATNAPTSCTASANTADSAFSGSISTPSGTDATVTEPVPASSRTFTVDCTNSGGSDSASIIVSASPAPLPTATLEIRNSTTGGGWQSSNLNITEGDQVEARWSSADATSCTKSFVAGTALSGGPIDITEPTVGNTTTYTLSCTGPGGSTPRQLNVRSYSNIPLLTASDTIVRPEDTVTFTWDTYLNNPALCTFAGPDAPGTITTVQGTADITIEGASLFTLTCPSGAAEVEIKIVPRLYES